MLRLAALLAILASPVLAQETLGIAGQTLDISGRSETVSGAVIDLVAPTRDLIPRVQDMITVTQVQKEVKIELPADVLFDFDKADIRPEAAIALSAAADLLKKGTVGAIKIDGHTDSKGAAAYNLTLSQNRARSVQAWFAKNGGLPANQAFALTGYGATRPKVPNAFPDGSDNPDGRQTNRRVEITFTPR